MKKRPDGRYLKVVTINGKRVYFYSTEDTEKKAAKDIERQMLEYREKTFKSPKKLSAVADAWEEEHFKNISHKTQAEYKPMKNRIVEAFGDRFVSEITPIDVEVFIRDIVSKNYSKNTVSAHLLVFKMIMRKAILLGYINYSPCDNVKIPKGLAKSNRELPSDETINKIKTSVKCHFGLFAYFVLYTGLRKGEALALTYDDIDFEKKIIKVDKVITFVNNRPVLRYHTKTEAGMRTVVLLDVLEEHLDKNGHGILFPGSSGEYMSEQSYKRHMERYKAESGVDCTAHQIRHAYATILYEAGISDKDTQTLMGHSDISVTRNIYQHIRQKKLDSARETLNAYTVKEGTEKTKC